MSQPPSHTPQPPDVGPVKGEHVGAESNVDAKQQPFTGTATEQENDDAASTYNSVAGAEQRNEMLYRYFETSTIGSGVSQDDTRTDRTSLTSVSIHRNETETDNRKEGSIQPTTSKPSTQPDQHQLYDPASDHHEDAAQSQHNASYAGLQPAQDAPTTATMLAPVASLVAPSIQPDFDIDDEAYAESTTTSYVTSIASEISRGILENERIYPNYGNHNYGMPVDEAEMDRMDLQHRKYELLLNDRHFLAPISDSPQNILDLGTGTGIWALDVADMFPSAQVIGVDIAPIQPKWVAPNCHFEIDDIESDWLWKKNHFDFIHLRDPLLVVRDWPKLMEQIYDHLKPGGWCELTTIYPVPTSDDGSMPPNSGFKTYCDRLMEAAVIFGAPIMAPHFAEYLRVSGHINVRENIFKIPSSPWPKDPRLKKIAVLEMTNVIAGATAFGLRMFEKVFGWSKEQTEVATIEFKRDVKNRSYHQYCP